MNVSCLVSVFFNALHHLSRCPQVLSAVGHLSGLALYTVLSTLEPLLAAALDVEGQSPSERFRWHRRFEAWRYGSGRDYESPE